MAQIRSEDERWYILSLETLITVTNPGIRPGQLLGLRIALQFDDVPVPARNQQFYLSARFVVTNDDEELQEAGRFAWLHSATAHWTPSLLMASEVVRERVIFERRIDDPVAGKIDAHLEAFTRPRGRWRKFGGWQLWITPITFAESIRRVRGGGFNFHPKEVPLDTGEDVEPPSLMKLVKYEGELPTGFDAPPAFLNYSEESKDEETP